jgi:hypothetical protein
LLDAFAPPPQVLKISAHFGDGFGHGGLLVSWFC